MADVFSKAGLVKIIREKYSDKIKICIYGMDMSYGSLHRGSSHGPKA